MKLSVVVVHDQDFKLLKQSLISVITAATAIDYEIIVFNNMSSSDVSLDDLMADFPEIKFIAAEKTLSYTRAANEGLRAAKGDFVLLLNPSIILSSDTLRKSISFMEGHPQTGALGVRMINGTGRFLPESKHGLPMAWIKFFKYLFLFRFFPKLRLPHMRTAYQWSEEFDNTEVDVLCRNFTLYRKSVLNEVGAFDERFAEYGQDIDLSYRIRLSGFKNYYFAKTHVVNYSNAHPNKLSLRYFKNYYGAMFIFALKYLLKMPAVSLEGTGKPVSASI